MADDGLGAWKGDAALAAASVGVFAANLAVSLYWPNEGIWGGDRVHGYLLNQLVTVSGLYLAFPPALLVKGLITWDARDLPPVTSLLACSLAVVAIALALTRFPKVPMWRRSSYAYLLGTQLAGF